MADEPRENRATAMLHASNEQPAPTAILSPAKRTALIACLKGGGSLHKRYGVWVSEAAGTDDKPVSGMTVADLSRNGDDYHARQKRLSAAHHARKLVCSNSGSRKCSRNDSVMPGLHDPERRLQLPR
jgi:hypothetical protein